MSTAPATPIATLRLVRMSVWPVAGRPYRDVLAIVSELERQGWDGAYIADHFMPAGTSTFPDDGPMLECFSTLAALSEATSRLRLGSLVAGNRYRHPAVLANVAATVSVISEGRFALGMGAGWQVNEHDAYGMDLGTVTDRLDHLEEAVQVVRSLLTQDRTSFDGRCYQLSDAPCEPKPVGRLPLIVGGKGERRTMRIAARFADEWNGWCTPEQLVQKGDVLDRHCSDVGRDPLEIERSTQAFVAVTAAQCAEAAAGPFAGRPWIQGSDDEITDQLGRFAEAGAAELIVPDWNHRTVGQALDALRHLFELAPRARDHKL